jgi:hypothetical protein
MFPLLWKLYKVSQSINNGDVGRGWLGREVMEDILLLKFQRTKDSIEQIPKGPYPIASQNATSTFSKIPSQLKLFQRTF